MIVVAPAGRRHRRRNNDHGTRRFVSGSWQPPAMAFDEREAIWLIQFQRGVLSTRQAQDCGFTPDAIRHRSSVRGRWQRLLPGVYLTSTGVPTREQLLTAALVYAGEPAVLSGPVALSAYGVKPPAYRHIDVLVPGGRQCASRRFTAATESLRAFVALHRTQRLPQPGMRDLAIAYAPVARAVADTVRELSARRQVRAVVASAVQKRACTVRELAVELAAGPRRGSGLFRSVLAEVADGIRSPAEAEFRDLIRSSGLPLPLFNPELHLNGTFLAKPDAWWPDRALIAEVDSQEWHLAPDAWEATMSRHSRLQAFGIRVLHYSPHQIRTRPRWILHDLETGLRTGKPIPGLVTIPAAA